MSINYSNLVPGEKVSDQACVLDADSLARYVHAVGDCSWPKSLNEDGAIAPPMAVAALSLSGLINDLGIPGGALHAGQELEFRDVVQVGTTLICKGTLLQNSVRRGWRFLVVQLDVEDISGWVVMKGKSTIMLPE